MVAKTGTRVVAIEISDTGIDIDKADIKRVMQPFEQAAGIFPRPHEDVGLGFSTTGAVGMCRTVKIHPSLNETIDA